MDFVLDTDFLAKYSNNQPFFSSNVHVKQRRHLIFTTDRQQDILRKAKTWYIDGTFKVIKDPFYQLLSVHAFVRARDDMKQLPLVLCVMSGKRKKDFKKVFQAIIDLLPGDPVKSFEVDFDNGLWRALKSLFNNPDIKGCSFHWDQAVWGKVQEKGLQTAYTQRDDVYKFLRKVFALPFLPADHILDTVTILQQKNVGDQLQTVMQYINDTWMHSTVWPISSWSVFGRSVRTNNNTE